jgi:hypothetical protein
MKEKRIHNLLEALTLLFMGTFAMPVLGGYLMLDKDAEMKFIGTILLFVGVVIWLMFALH